MIKYTLSNRCFAAVTATVNPLPAPITGLHLVCIGSPETLADATAGGSWSSSNTARASVGVATGVVTGIATGSLRITYALAPVVQLRMP